MYELLFDGERGRADELTDARVFDNRDVVATR